MICSLIFMIIVSGCTTERECSRPEGQDAYTCMLECKNTMSAAGASKYLQGDSGYRYYDDSTIQRKCEERCCYR